MQCFAAGARTYKLITLATPAKVEERRNNERTSHRPLIPIIDVWDGDDVGQGKVKDRRQGDAG